MSQYEPFEEALAGILLQTLKGKMHGKDGANRVEEACVRLYHEGSTSQEYQVPPALLEAIVSLSKRSPELTERMISCLLMLSCFCAQSWKTLMDSEFAGKTPQFGSIVTAAFLNRYTWGRLPISTQQKLLNALCDLSRIEYYEESCWLRNYPKTPLLLALETTLNELSCDADENRPSAKDTVAAIFGACPGEALEVIPEDKTLNALKVLLNTHINTEPLQPRLLGGFAKDSPVRQKLCALFEFHQDIPFVNKWLRLTPRIAWEATPSSESNSIPVVRSLNEAYDITRSRLSDNKEGEIVQSANCWMRSKNYLFIAAAYLAAPVVLQRVTESCKEVCEALVELPETLRSPIDSRIDDALFGLMRTIPELKTVLAPETNEDETEPSIKLKRIALMYPHLVARRILCLAACVITVLQGLSDPSSKYSKAALNVVNIIFAITTKLPSRLPIFVEVVADTALRFLLEENRLHHGIPIMLSQLASSLFILFSRHTSGFLRDKLLASLPTIIANNNANYEVKEAAQKLYIHLRSS